MKKTTLCVLIMALAMVFLASSAFAAKPGPVVQPEQAPSFGTNWTLDDENLPAVADIVKLPGLPRPVYGLYTWCGEYRNHRESIKKVGLRCLRVAGPFDDATVKMLAEDDMEVMATLGVHVTGTVKKRPDYDSDEAFIADYTRAVIAFLDRYGPDGAFFKENPGIANRPIKAVEIWNEPNFHYMIPASKTEKRPVTEAKREALYAKLLPAAYKAIKAKYPDMTVVGFGCGGMACGDVRFIQHVHKINPDVGKAYDALSTHPYVRPAPPEGFAIHSWGKYSIFSAYKQIREAMAKAGAGDKPLWYTEVGWPISKEDGGRFPTPKGKKDIIPLEYQAPYVVRQYAYAMRLGVPRVTIMFITDSDGFNGGFFHRNKDWRPVAYAVQNMIRVMPHPKLLDVIHDGGAEGLCAYVFQPDRGKAGKKVIMAWNIRGPKTIDLPMPAGVTSACVTDMFGYEKSVDVADGKVSVEVGPAPIYVTAAE